MKYIIARHAQAGGNKDKTIMSWSDQPLTRLGHAQAIELSKKLEDYHFDAIYTSPLGRSVASLQPFLEKTKLVPTQDARLKEVNFGDLIGQPEDSIPDIFGKRIHNMFDAYDYDLTAHNGESSQQVESRVRSFLDDVKKTNAKTVLIMTHDGALRWLHYLLSGKKMTFTPPNASLYEYLT